MRYRSPVSAEPTSGESTNSTGVVIRFAENAENAGGVSSETHFSPESFPDALRAPIEDCCRVFGVNWDLPAMIALSCISAAIGKGLQLVTGEFTTRGNLFCLASAPSGSGKSSCFRPLVKPLQEIELQLLSEHGNRLPVLEAERDLLESEAGRLLRDKKGSSSNAPRLAEIKTRLAELESLCKPPQLIAENITIEALSLLMEENGESLAMMSPDGSEVITNLMGRYNKTDRTDEGVLLKAWTGEPCRINRLSRRPVSLKNPCLSLLLCCTPDEVRNLFENERFITGGLMPRFLVCESQSRPKARDGSRVSLNSDVWDYWGHLISMLYEHYHCSDTPETIHTSAEAIAEFDAAHNAYCHSFNLRPQGDSFEARRVEQAMRLAVCLHAAEYGERCHCIHISKTTAKAAIKLATFYGEAGTRRQAAARFDSDLKLITRISETADKYGALAQHGVEIAIREIVRRNGIKPESIRALAQAHPERIAVVTIPAKGKSGRRSEIICVKH